MTDEIAIAPFVDLRAWCWDRLAHTIQRLSRISGPTVPINDWPMVQEPPLKRRRPAGGPSCSPRQTRRGQTRDRAEAVMYGHLHMPSVEKIDGVDHIEVSLGYPREWLSHQGNQLWSYPVLTMEEDET